MADHPWVEYWPHPHQAIEHCKGNANENQGKEHTIEELGEYDESEIKGVGHNLLSIEFARCRRLVPSDMGEPSHRRESVPSAWHLRQEAVHPQ